MFNPQDGVVFSYRSTIKGGVGLRGVSGFDHGLASRRDVSGVRETSVDRTQLQGRLLAGDHNSGVMRADGRPKLATVVN